MRREGGGCARIVYRLYIYIYVQFCFGLLSFLHSGSGHHRSKKNAASGDGPLQEWLAA